MKREPRLAGLRRVFSLPRNTRSIARDVDDEIAFHIESLVGELVARGVPPAAARREAMARYGSLSESRRELVRVDRTRLTREGWGNMVSAFLQDLAFAVRLFRTRPGYTFATVFVFALGIGANATMFGVVDRLLLRPPPHVADADRVMMLRFLRTSRGAVDEQDALSYPLYMDTRDTPSAFADVAAYVSTNLAIGRGAEARRVAGMQVTASFFRTLGVRPRLGRFFLPEEDGNPVAPNVAVISYSYWQRDFDGDAGVLGRTLPVGDARFTIVGVAPAGFTGVDNEPVDVWVPLTAGITPAAFEQWKQSRNGYWLLGVARLAPGVARETAASAATRHLQESLRREGVSDERIAEQRPGIGFVSVLPSEARAGDARARVARLLAAVSFVVLLIACANVANLQLARGIARRREIAVRVALGVSRARLLTQLLTESVVLAVAGGVGALFIAFWGSNFVRRVLLGSSDLAGDSPVDARVLAFTALASIVVGLLSGAMPALQAGRASITAELKDGARQGGAQRAGARATLLIVQTMLSVVLLVGTGLFIRSLRRVDALPIGLEPQRTLLATVATAGTNYGDAQLTQMYQRMLDAVQHEPIVQSAALATSLPFYTSWVVRVRVPGRDSLPRIHDGGPYMNEVTPAFFQTVGTRILRGRAFTVADQATSPRVVIINESLAKLWWPNEDAMGKCMRIGSDSMPCSEIVGIAENSRRQAIVEETSIQYFIPMTQSIRTTNVSYVLLIRPRGDAGAAIQPLRRQLQSVAANLPYVNVRSFDDFVSPQKRSWRLGATMFATFGLLALVLSAVGLYSVLAYDVAQRTREFGVRVAIGAQGADVMRIVFLSGIKNAVLGGAAGLVVAVGAGRWVAPLLFETSPRDPAVFSAALAVVVVVAFFAALLPARRALRVDPIVALRAG